MTTEKDTFLKGFTRAVRDGDAALFIGAGISHASGYVDWKKLLREIAEELDLDIDRETDLVSLAQFHVNKRRSRDRLNQLLIDEFLENVALTKSHQLIGSLPVHTVWTTNYDDLLEAAFEAAGKRVDVKRRVADFTSTRRRSDVTIYKMHGDRTAPSEAVLTKEDFETYDLTRELFSIALKSDLARKTFLFLGFSFADPNVMYLLARVKQLLERNGRQHFCLLKPPDAGTSPYECKRYVHWLEDLHRYNIQPITIESYDEVPAILGELNRRSHLRDVFISGSAAVFEPLGEAAFHDLCRSLGSELIRTGYNIISGFGLGVGDSVIVGAMQSLPRNDDERLQLWPFPQSVPEGVDRALFWRGYRERMISNSGVCLVLGGNKAEDGRVVPAGGVREEVEIALSQGKAILPVGVTGHVAKELWDQCIGDPGRFLRLTPAPGALATLGDPAAGIAAWVNAVMEMLKLLDR